MDRSLVEGEFYAAYEVSEPVREATSVVSSEVASSSVEAVNGEYLAVLTPKSARELAEIYGVSDKSVQTWFKTVCDAYCWLDPIDLKVGTSNKIRYTALCQQLLADYRSSGMSPDQWVAHIHAANPDKLTPPAPAPTMEIPSVEAEIEDISTSLVIGSRGQITTQQSTRQAEPLLKLDIQSFQIQLPQADTTVLDADTQKLQGITDQAIAALTQYVKADLQAKVSQLLSQNNNLASAIQTAATVGAVQGIQSPKPQAESAAGTTS